MQLGLGFKNSLFQINFLTFDFLAGLCEVDWPGGRPRFLPAVVAVVALLDDAVLLIDADRLGGIFVPTIVKSKTAT